MASNCIRVSLVSHCYLHQVRKTKLSNRFLIRIFINFILEKLLSTEAVLIGIVRQMFARVLMLGKIVLSISSVLSSVSSEHKVPFGCLDR